jgi:hypothetical protein
MRSTGVYWIPLFQLLEARGLQVYLVNAHYRKSVPGRKSDVSDCQWIQYLYSVGLLRASFRPPEEICALRTLWRHRSSLLQMAAERTLHMQKALSLMNVQIHHVLSDITGMSGQAIIDAILQGQRDPVTLAQLCNRRVKSPREKVAKALAGDYRAEHLFTLKQSLDGYRYYQKLIAELDQEISRLMQKLPSVQEPSAPMPERTKHTAYQRCGNDPAFDLRGELYRIAGVDLTDVPGISAATAQVILAEIGPDGSCASQRKRAGACGRRWAEKARLTSRQAGARWDMSRLCPPCERKESVISVALQLGGPRPAAAGCRLLVRWPGKAPPPDSYSSCAGRQA